MRYIIIPSSETQSARERTEALSRELYRLSRPIPTEGDVTEFLFGFAENVNGDTGMVCDTETEIPVHPLAETDGLVDILAPTEEQMPEIAEIAFRIDEARGGSIKFADIVPSWVTLLTAEEFGLPTGGDEIG